MGMFANNSVGTFLCKWVEVGDRKIKRGKNFPKKEGSGPDTGLMVNEGPKKGLNPQLVRQLICV